MKLATTFILTAFTLLSSPSTHAGPLAERQLATLSQDEINSFLPYSLFAKTGYCGPAKTQNWNCGTWCEQLPGFTTVASGGNGGAIQNWYVGYYPTFSSVVVGYQGTNLSNIEAILTDLNFFPRTPSQSLFPGLPSSAKVHGGFLDAYSKTQAAVFAGVQQALTTFGTNKVILTGHSLGGALATISAASMKLRLGPDYSFKVVSYSCPRIGDRNWVDWVDSNLEVTRVTNKKDPVPILPGRSLGFVGSQDEIHIRASDEAWVVCPGNDSVAAGCTIADVPNILVGNFTQHIGPYNGILMNGDRKSVV